MPEMDGLETTRRLRTRPRYARMPIIAMTAHAMEGDREMCIEAGLDDYIAKPIEPEVLAETLRRWIPARASCAVEVEKHTEKLSTKLASAGFDITVYSRKKYTKSDIKLTNDH